MGKLMILTFNDAEEDMVDAVLGILENKVSPYSPLVNPNIDRIEFENLMIDGCERMVYKKGQNIKLTFIEFEILYLLIRSPGRVFSKEQIYNSVWNEPTIGDCSIIMNHIQKIRKKIGDDSSNPTYIQTVWGVGYRFNKEISSNL